MLTLPNHITNFMDLFRHQGYQIYLVGGAVRNLLLKKTTDNWDFTTNATPEQILALFPTAFYHNDYGTVTVVTENNTYEITPFRKEAEYFDLRHPNKIAWANTIEEDLARRDFTINALAYDGKTIIDPYNGKIHLKQKIIVAVGNPEKRFSEDALRLIRAVRLAAQLGFLIEEKTRQAIKKNAHLIQSISWERIRDELIKILASSHPSEGIIFLKNLQLLHYILPELEICFSIPQKSPYRHHIYDVGTHLIMSLKHCPSTNPITRLATLLHDIGKAKVYHQDKKTGLITFYNHEVVGEKMVRQIATRLKLTNKDKEKLVLLVKHHQFSVSEIITDKAIRRFIKEVGKDNLQDILDLRRADRIGSGAKPTSWRTELFKKRLITVQKEPFKVTDLKINGYDVMQIKKLQPSPQVGKILKIIFKEVEKGKLKNERQQLLAYLHDLDK
jgi:putative nucleotidyltransferase with HDIG domain